MSKREIDKELKAQIMGQIFNDGVELGLQKLGSRVSAQGINTRAARNLDQVFLRCASNQFSVYTTLAT
jgi:hypothetical protein